jgi:hypothetical protein
MSLELDRVRSSVGDGIDEGVPHAERAVMRLRDFSDQQGRAARPHVSAGDAQAVQVWDPRLTSVFISTWPRHDLTARTRVYPKPAALAVHG